MKRRKILVADLLCGAGGSSTGAARALAARGLEMELVCVNHWPIAIDTHTKNHPLEDPLPTLTTAHRGEQALVEGTPQFDILFRMLQPHELAAAMGFDRDEARYEFAGNKTEQIKQIGNAVAVEMMEAEVGAFFADEADAVPDFLEAAE